MSRKVFLMAAFTAALVLATPTHDAKADTGGKTKAAATKTATPLLCSNTPPVVTYDTGGIAKTAKKASAHHRLPAECGVVSHKLFVSAVGAHKKCAANAAGYYGRAGFHRLA